MKRLMLSAVLAGVTYILLHMNTAHAQVPNGFEDLSKFKDVSAPVYYYGAKCSGKLALWIGLENGHVIQYDAEHMPLDNDWGKLLKKLEGLPNSVVDLCPDSKL